jgi:outer membrane protein
MNLVNKEQTGCPDQNVGFVLPRIMSVRRQSAAIAISLALFSQSAVSQTLQEALSAAYQNNPTLLSERAQLRAVDEHVSQALSGWRPTVQIVADARAQHNTVSEAPGGRPNPYAIGNHSYFASDYGVAVKQPIYRGGRTVAETAKATAEVDSERAHLAAVEQSVMLITATDYLDVVLAQSLVGLTVEHEHETASHHDQIAHMFKAGIITATDLAEADIAAVHATAIRRQEILALDVARSNFTRDTGLSAQELKSTQIPLELPTSRNQTLDLAAEANPNLLEALETAKASGSAIDVARGRLLPSVNLVGSVGHRDNYPFERRREDDAAIGIELSIPLYDGGTGHSQVREASQIHSALERKSDAERADTADVAGSSWDRLQAASDDLELARRASLGSEAIFKGMEKEFTLGKRSVRELVDAMKDRLKARIAYALAQHDEAVARFTLAVAVGRLNARQLALPAQLYDPAEHLNAVRNRWFGTEDKP